MVPIAIVGLVAVVAILGWRGRRATEARRREAPPGAKPTAEGGQAATR